MLFCTIISRKKNHSIYRNIHTPVPRIVFSTTNHPKKTWKCFVHHHPCIHPPSISEQNHMEHAILWTQLYIIIVLWIPYSRSQLTHMWNLFVKNVNVNNIQDEIQTSWKIEMAKKRLHMGCAMGCIRRKKNVSNPTWNVQTQII